MWWWPGSVGDKVEHSNLSYDLSVWVQSSSGLILFFSNWTGWLWPHLLRLWGFGMTRSSPVEFGVTTIEHVREKRRWVLDGSLHGHQQWSPLALLTDPSGRWDRHYHRTHACGWDVVIGCDLWVDRRGGRWVLNSGLGRRRWEFVKLRSHGFGWSSSESCKVVAHQHSLRVNVGGSNGTTSELRRGVLGEDGAERWSIHS